jgi:hypothetical protein
MPCSLDPFFTTMTNLNDQMLLVFSKLMPMKTLFTTAKTAFTEALIIHCANTSARVLSLKELALINHVFIINNIMLDPKFMRVRIQGLLFSQ